MFLVLLLTNIFFSIYEPTLIDKGWSHVETWLAFLFSVWFLRVYRKWNVQRVAAKQFGHVSDLWLKSNCNVWIKEEREPNL